MSMGEQVYPVSTLTSSENSSPTFDTQKENRILIENEKVKHNNKAKKKSFLARHFKLILISFFGTIIVISGAILFMCLVGMIPFSDPVEKDKWIEINSQILNAVFTLNVIVSHPSRILDMKRYLQKSSKDILLLRRKYLFLSEAFDLEIDSHLDDEKPSLLSMGNPQTQNSALDQEVAVSESAEAIIATNHENSTTDITKKVAMKKAKSTTMAKDISSADTTKEKIRFVWRRLFMILVLLNLNCFTQYPITAAMWGWATQPSSRPNTIVYICLPLSFLSGCGAGCLQFLYDRKYKNKKDIKKP